MIRSLFENLYDTLLKRFVWSTLVISILLLALFPPAVNLICSKWDEGSPDNYVSYFSDGASLALGGRIYLTNHPGTPIHEFYAWTTTLLRWILFCRYGLSHRESQKAMIEWIQLYPQTCLFLIQFLRLLPYLGLLLGLMCLSAPLFGNRWLGLFAAITIASGRILPKLIHLHVAETFLIFILPIVYYYAVQFLENPPKISRLIPVVFWIALLLSFKITNLPVAFVFLFHVFMFSKDSGHDFTEGTRKKIAFAAFVALPLMIGLFFTAILIFEFSKLPFIGIHKLIWIAAASYAQVLCYRFWTSYRKLLLQHPYFAICLIGLAVFFVLINAPMSWAAWIGFFLYDTWMGFRLDRFRNNWGYMAGSPLSCWTFWIGVASWVLCICYRDRIRQSYNRTAICLLIPMMLPLYLGGFSFYDMRVNYFFIIDSLCVLFAFSVLGFIFHFRHIRSATVFEKTLYGALCISLLYPLSMGQLYFTPRVMLERDHDALVKLESSFPSFLDQGRDPRKFYSPMTRHFLDFANHYSSFRFPTLPENTAQERREREERFQQTYHLHESHR